MRIVHEVGKYIGIEQEGVERLRYQYALASDPTPSAPKPFIHPIRTPDGVEMTAHAPIDHFWHRGLWFAFKYVNGVNYWEERDAIIGRQVARECPEIACDGEQVRWRHAILWTDAEKPERMEESREITVRFLERDVVQLDWRSQFVVPYDDAILLDRTPYTTWGGYGGLFLRMTQLLQKQRLILAGETAAEEPIIDTRAVGTPHRWGAIEGQLDAGFDTGAKWGAFVLLPSPHNFAPKERFPEPFYGDAKQNYNFFGPAPLFHAPLLVQDNRPVWSLSYDVRVLIFSRRLEIPEIEQQYTVWMEECRRP